MVCLEIEDVKSFMNNFLIKETFDTFLLYEIELHTFIKMELKGNINKKWFSTDELEIIGDREYARWKEIKPQVFGLIKGSKPPTFIKAVLMLSRNNVEKILTTTRLDYKLEEVNSLLLNIRFENNKLSIITGTSLNTFKMDKLLEHEWDSIAKEILKKNGIL